LAEAPPEIARRALQQALATVGGGAYPPRSARLDRLLEELRAASGCAGRTLAGCRIVPWRDDLLICRELAAIAPPLRLARNLWQHWDRRFLVRWQASDAGGEPVVRALGADGWRACKAHGSCSILGSLPSVVCAGLPSVWRDERLVAVAGLGPVGSAPGGAVITLRFRPGQPLAGPPFVAIRAGLRPAPYLRIAHDDTFASI
jgi:tRNA(Ile)-lysidine synthase